MYVKYLTNPYYVTTYSTGVEPVLYSLEGYCFIQLS
jgi:hypothetical protein